MQNIRKKIMNQFQEKCVTDELTADGGEFIGCFRQAGDPIILALSRNLFCWIFWILMYAIFKHISFQQRMSYLPDFWNYTSVNILTDIPPHPLGALFSSTRIYSNFQRKIKFFLLSSVEYGPASLDGGKKLKWNPYFEKKLLIYFASLLFLSVNCTKNSSWENNNIEIKISAFFVYLVVS